MYKDYIRINIQWNFKQDTDFFAYKQSKIIFYLKKNNNITGEK